MAPAVFAGGFTELAGITLETELLYTGTVPFWIRLAREKKALLTVHVTQSDQCNMVSCGMHTPLRGPGRPAESPPHTAGRAPSDGEVQGEPGPHVSL